VRRPASVAAPVGRGHVRLLRRQLGEQQIAAGGEQHHGGDECSHEATLASRAETRQNPTVRRQLPIVLLFAASAALAGRSGKLVEANYDIVLVNKENAVFDFDLRPTVHWKAFHLPVPVRSAAEDARKTGCTVYAYFRCTDGTQHKYDRESVLVTCSGDVPALKTAGFWFIPSVRVTTRTGAQKSSLVHDGSAWLWPKPSF
jgi:hypothetical protein